MNQFLNKYGYYLVAAIMVVAIFVFWLGNRKPEPPPRSYSGDTSLMFFVDERTGLESIHSADEIPPLTADDGTDSLVMAIKFKAANETDAKIYYFVKYPIEVRNRARQLDPNDMERMGLLESSRLVRAAVPGSPWMSASDPRAEAFLVVPEATLGNPRRPVFPTKR